MCKGPSSRSAFLTQRTGFWSSPDPCMPDVQCWTSTLLAWTTSSSYPTRCLLRTMPMLSAKAGGLGFKGSSATAFGSQSRTQALPLTPGLPHPAWPVCFSSKRRGTKFLGSSSRPRQGLGIGVPRLEGTPKRYPIQLQLSPQGSGGDAPQTAVPPRPKQTGKWERCFLPRRWRSLLPRALHRG